MQDFCSEKTFAFHKCVKCSTHGSDELDSWKNAFFDFKAYDSESSTFGGLIAPSEAMLSYTTALEDLFVAYFKKLKQTHIGRDLLQMLDQVKLDVEYKRLRKAFCKNADIPLLEI